MCQPPYPLLRVRGVPYTKACVVSRYQDRIDLGYEFSQTLMKKLAHAVTPLGVSPPEAFDSKLVYIMGNTTCEPKPGNALPSLSEAVLCYAVFTRHH